MVIDLPILEETFVAEASLAYLIVRVGHILSRGFAGQMGSVGLSVRQFAILSEVARLDGIGSAELARAMGVTAQSAGEQVEAMVEAGLLRRDPPFKGRKTGIHLTAAGRRRLVEASCVASTYEEDLIGHLKAGERRRFKDGLEEMARRV